MIDKEYITTFQFQPENNKVTFNTNHRDQFFDLLNRLIVEHDLDIEEIFSPDDNLQAVFDYLVGK
jgi:ABC-2 type transport system ATP-binding protein